MSIREALPTARRSTIGVLLVGVLVAACRGNGSPVAISPSTPASPAAAESVVASSALAKAATSSAGSSAASSPAASSPAGAAATNAPSTSPANASPTTDGSPALASPVGLAAGQVGTRAQIPWSEVGPGWFLATSDTSSVQSEFTSAPARKGGNVTLSLVSPIGARYLITSWPGFGSGSDPMNTAALTAWSGNGREALFSNPGGLVVEVNLMTGARRKINVPGLSTAGFTSPTGANLVALVDKSAADGSWLGQTLVRLDLNGKPQVTIVDADRAALQWLYSPDGATVYLNGQGRLRAVSNGGGAIRDLATFTTPDAECAPVAWWDQHTILASCNGDAGFRLWLVPASGGSATPLTAVPGKGPVGLGYDDAVRAGDAVFAQHLEGCGVVTIHRLAPNGVGTRVAIPQSLSNDHLIGAVGGKIAVQSSTECGAPSWFGFYDPATNTTQKIVAGAPGEVGALAAVAFP